MGRRTFLLAVLLFGCDKNEKGQVRQKAVSSEAPRVVSSDLPLGFFDVASRYKGERPAQLSRIEGWLEKKEHFDRLRVQSAKGDFEDWKLLVECKSRPCSTDDLSFANAMISKIQSSVDGDARLAARLGVKNVEILLVGDIVVPSSEWRSVSLAQRRGKYFDVEIQLTKSGADKLKNHSRRAIGHRMAFVVDTEAYFAADLASQVTAQQLVIRVRGKQQVDRLSKALADHKLTLQRTTNE